MTLFNFNIQPKWDDLYEATVFELNPGKLLVRIDVARNAIQSRLMELNGQDGNAGERRRLVDAARMLEMLLWIESTSSDQNRRVCSSSLDSVFELSMAMQNCVDAQNPFGES